MWRIAGRDSHSETGRLQHDDRSRALAGSAAGAPENIRVRDRSLKESESIHLHSTSERI